MSLVAMWAWIILLGVSFTSSGRAHEGRAESRVSSQFDPIFEYLGEMWKDAVVCPHPYTFILDDCFYINRKAPKFTYDEAVQFCKLSKGRLAEPKYPGAIAMHLFNFYAEVSFASSVPYDMWVGARVLENGTAIWASETENGDFEEGLCGVLVLNGYKLSVIRPAECDRRYSVICQLVRGEE